MTAASIRLSVKRGSDILGSAVGLVVLSPVLAWTSVLLFLTQGRPVCFHQLRPGLHDAPFTIHKFRTMREPRPGENRFRSDERRVTRFGRFLRSTSIDELPELWNVLRGDMSLVGPRPLLMEYLETYTPDERRRHDMRPGVTSWAAVNGRHTMPFADRLAMDIWYIDNWSLRLDVQIITMTFGQVLRRRDVATTQDMAAVGFPIAPTADDGADEP